MCPKKKIQWQIMFVTPLVKFNILRLLWNDIVTEEYIYLINPIYPACIKNIHKNSGFQYENNHCQWGRDSIWEIN